MTQGSFLTLFLACLCLPGSASALPASHCDPAPALPGESVDLTIEHEGIDREYSLHIPASYDCESKVPLLVAIHGYSNDMHRFEQEQTMLPGHIEQHGYIAVFPQGLYASEENQWATAWNDLTSQFDDGPDGSICAWPTNEYPDFDNCPESEHRRRCDFGRSCADDLGFVRKLIEHLLGNYAIDPARVYMTGHSMGAIATLGFAAGLQDLLAAVAPSQGQAANGFTDAPQSPVGLIHVWGRQDEIVPGTGEPASDGLIYDTADELLTAWAEAQGCSAQATDLPTISDGKHGWSCVQHAQCRTGVAVVGCAWDAGHTWPREGDDHFGWDVIWPFLARHRKP